ncbi:MAG: MMPL family transporter [Gammaproteobacteria bacterium]
MRLLRKTGLQLLKNWIDLVQKYRVAVILVAVISAVSAFHYTVNNIGMDSDTKDLLSEDLQWQKLDRAYERHFPQYLDNVLVVVEADTPDQAMDAARALYDEFGRGEDSISGVYYPYALEIIRQSSLLFLNTGELQDLADNLAAIQPFLSKLTEDQTLRGLFDMLSDAIDAMEDGEEIDIEPLLRQINTAITSVEDNKPFRVSWQHLMRGEETEKDVYREYIVLQPELNYSKLFPVATAIEKIRERIKQAHLSGIGARVNLTGSAMLAHEEMKSVTRGTGIALGLALLVVTVIMWLGLGSVRLVIASLLTLITGLIFTAGFATAAIGNLNLISVAFAVLYIGLGVDFAIHYCLRYRELLANDMDKHDAIDESSLNTGRSLFLCTMTTAIGFFAFVPTDYDGVAELGLISGVGMFISLIVTMTLLPALLSLLPLKKPVQMRSPGLPLPRRIGAFPLTHARSVRWTALLLSVLALAAATQIRFDYNTLNLQNADNESVITFKSLLSDPDTSPWRGVIVAQGRDDAQRTMTQLEALPVVEDVIWLEDFIPGNQPEKLAIIEEMNLLLFGLPQPGEVSSNITTGEQYDAVREFNDRLGQTPLLETEPVMNRLHRDLSAYVDNLEQMGADERARSLETLSESILASLPGRLQTLRESLQAVAVSVEDLPQQIVRRWRSDEDGYLLEIMPVENLMDNGAMRRFVKEIQKRDERLIGAPVVTLEASDAVVGAFAQAFLYAFAVIALFLFIVLKHKRDAIYILTPLTMAAVFTASATVLLDMPFNFANIIALPLLLGIGVDSGIHILHRYRTALPAHKNILATSTARAVVVSALTTMGSIGNLAFSHHTGTASMGKLLTLGIAVTLICMLIILPSLLARENRSQ